MTEISGIFSFLKILIEGTRCLKVFGAHFDWSTTLVDMSPEPCTPKIALLRAVVAFPGNPNAKIGHRVDFGGTKISVYQPAASLQIQRFHHTAWRLT